ncbi:MAG: phage gp6-like head-tail connector protein [Lachnospiraceae bacterium]|nr:phage gp6-like head-tail connector protein [Lachnospiraceae bacterium]
MILTLEEVKNYLRVDLEEDDNLIISLIAAAETYLKNATGKEYPEENEQGERIAYELEKVYLKLLIAYWYENRSTISQNKGASGGVPDEFTYATRSLLLQLQL